MMVEHSLHNPEDVLAFEPQEVRKVASSIQSKCDATESEPHQQASVVVLAQIRIVVMQEVGF
jgi:hypothetical protein